MAKSWKGLLYVAHRWTGIVLGVFVAIWFSSGIVMMYYTWPTTTESVRHSLLTPFELPPSLIGFAAAEAKALSAAQSSGMIADSRERPVGARLKDVAGRPIYHVWWDRPDRWEWKSVLVDGVSGTILSPLPDSMTIAVARKAAPEHAAVVALDRLRRGDAYMMNTDYTYEFPGARVTFDDPSATAIYVGDNTAIPFGRVTTRARLTTWFGTIPHWFYFYFLLDNQPLWSIQAIYLPAFAAVLALTGIVLGFVQLFPRRRRGEWRITPYRGVSKWHHIAGIVFGFLVLLWCYSAIRQVTGTTNEPREQHVAPIRGGETQWHAIEVTARQALDTVLAVAGSSVLPVAIDLTQFDGRPGYHLFLADDREFWVDAVTGAPRGEITAAEAEQAARGALGVGTAAYDAEVERITTYDTYYYARPYREEHLPAWRVTFDDPNGSTIYLNTISGAPVGYVGAEMRRDRWLRDAVHSHDWPLLNGRRPLWDLVVLPLMLGGLVAAVTGVWLLVRRVSRISRAAR